MEKITHQMRLQQWSKIISECLASGQNKTAWCRQNGISDKKFFYWQKILRREEEQQKEAWESCARAFGVHPTLESLLFLEGNHK